MLLATAGFLIADIIGLWLMLTGNLPFSRTLLVEYHYVVILMAIFAAAYAALHASQPGRYKVPAVVAFLVVIAIFNPFYPIVITTEHAIVADLIAVLLFVFTTHSAFAKNSFHEK